MFVGVPGQMDKGVWHKCVQNTDEPAGELITRGHRRLYNDPHLSVTLLIEILIEISVVQMCIF